MHNTGQRFQFVAIHFCSFRCSQGRSQGKSEHISKHSSRKHLHNTNPSPSSSCRILPAENTSHPMTNSLCPPPACKKGKSLGHCHLDAPRLRNRSSTRKKSGRPGPTITLSGFKSQCTRPLACHARDGQDEIMNKLPPGMHRPETRFGQKR